MKIEASRPFVLDGKTVKLVDIPSFEGVFAGDLETLKTIATFIDDL